MWNLAVEQHRLWHRGRKSAPGYLARCRQLTQARGEHPWLTAGSQMGQQCCASAAPVHARERRDR